MDDHDFLKRAIELSQESVDVGGYPVGAVIVSNGEILATGLSNGKQLHDPTSHAETAAIREAARKLGERDLVNVVLYSSLEPCLMCYTSSFWAHIPRVVFACGRDKVASEYYEGDHNIFILNEKSRRSIELIHEIELEEEALVVIHEWERSKKFEGRSRQRATAF